MSFTNKISGIIKDNLANLSGGLTSKLSSFVPGGLKSTFGQPAKIAAKLANKSPLDVSTSPVAHMQPQYNPFQYGMLYYPQETSNLGDGHYVVFDIISNNKTNKKFKNKTFNNKGILVSKGQVGENEFRNRQKRLADYKKKGFVNANAETIVRQQSGGFNSQNSTHINIETSIFLYTPASVNFKYGVTYEDAETGFIGDFLELKKNLNWANTGSFTKKILEKMAITTAEILVPGLSGAVSKVTGVSMNPQMELAFKSVPFRSFDFPFVFAPKNKDELDTVHKIIRLFKFHMMPEKYKTGYLTTPSEFQITYYYKEGVNTYIPKISRCALESMEVDYSPNGVFSTFKPDEEGAAPVITNVNLTFKEMEIMTKETIAEGH